MCKRLEGGGFWRLEMRLGLVLGDGNAFGVESGPECWGEGVPPPPPLQAIPCPWGDLRVELTFVRPHGEPPIWPAGTWVAPDSPGLAPDTPRVAPDTPRVAPDTPRVAPDSGSALSLGTSSLLPVPAGMPGISGVSPRAALCSSAPGRGGGGTSTSSIRQLLGAADTQTAHHATFSTVPTHQLLGSANAETTPARAPAAAADRKQRPDATCEGKNG